MEIQELGARIKRIRKARGLTLKDIEARSQVSATHISEIERGKTSPTIGALSRIATALGKDTAFFLERQNLEDVSKIKYEDRKKIPFKQAKGYYQPLTMGIPGGHLQTYRMHIEPKGIIQYEDPEHEGEATVFCSQGEILFSVKGEEHTLHEGDSVHFTAEFAPRIENSSAEIPAELILVSTRRYSVENL